jgi:hypothetical protein
MKQFFLAVAAVAALGASAASNAQTVNTRDQQELLISQIQADKRAVVLSAMDLNEAEVRGFTPLYDEYQAEMKQIATRTTDLINKFAANYGSMTDGAAKDILKDFFALREDRLALTKKYSKRMERALPPTKVLQWVQIENKLTALLDVEAASIVPVSR